MDLAQVIPGDHPPLFGDGFPFLFKSPSHKIVLLGKQPDQGLSAGG
jgi:hypothetical protein